MKSIHLIKELEKYAVFTAKTIRDITGKKASYVKLLLYRLKKEGLIREIEKNKYTTHKDVLVVGTNIIWPCYFTCWTALRFHNLTEQLPTTIFVISTRARKKRKLKFDNTNIVFIKTKQKFFFGYKKENYANFTIFVAEPEKAIIDSVLFKKISFSEIENIVKNNIKSINVELLIQYLIRIKKKSLIKRFGFLLDKIGFDFFPKLNKFLDGKYILLDYASEKQGKKNDKWMVIKNC